MDEDEIRLNFKDFILKEGALSGKLELEMETVTPCFIGGNGEEFFAPDGTPTIPGSSLRHIWISRGLSSTWGLVLCLVYAMTAPDSLCLLMASSSFVIISGGIYLSVGSQICALGAILLYLIEPNFGLLLKIGLTGPAAYTAAIITVILIGFILGYLNGSLIAIGKLPPFIATLGTMKIYRSVTQQLTKKFNPTVPNGFKAIASTKINGQVILPIIYWIAVVIIMHIIFKKTASGRQTIAIGSNERAAKLSGINVSRTKRMIYSLCGVMCSLGAVIYIARIGSMDFAKAGNGYEMDAIAAVIVGGTAMSGGRGSLIGAFLGMLITGVMNNILNSVGVPTFLTEAVKGLIIIFAVLLQKKDN